MVKKFKCKICNMSYNDILLLNTHIYIKHNTEQFNTIKQLNNTVECLY